jgi:hypothetical protein
LSAQVRFPALSRCIGGRAGGARRQPGGLLLAHFPCLPVLLSCLLGACRLRSSGGRPWRQVPSGFGVVLGARGAAVGAPRLACWSGASVKQRRPAQPVPSCSLGAGLRAAAVVMVVLGCVAGLGVMPVASGPPTADPAAVAHKAWRGAAGGSPGCGAVAVPASSFLTSFALPLSPPASRVPSSCGVVRLARGAAAGAPRQACWLGAVESPRCMLLVPPRSPGARPGVAGVVALLSRCAVGSRVMRVASGQTSPGPAAVARNAGAGPGAAAGSPGCAAVAGPASFFLTSLVLPPSSPASQVYASCGLVLGARGAAAGAPRLVCWPGVAEVCRCVQSVAPCSPGAGLVAAGAITVLPGCAAG